MEKVNKFEDFEAQMSVLIGLIKKDGEKFYTNDNRAAAVRLRKGLKAIKQYVQAVSAATSAKPTE